MFCGVTKSWNIPQIDKKRQLILEVKQIITFWTKDYVDKLHIFFLWNNVHRLIDHNKCELTK